VAERDLGVWLYAVGRELAEPEATGLTGVDAEPVRTIHSGALTAMVGSVDLATFGEEGLRDRLNDLDQLERIARAHHRVVSVAAGQGPVIPARLATVYHDDDGIRRALAEQQDAFEGALDRIEGRQEWGVKVYAEPMPAADEERARPTSGAAYLRSRESALHQRERAQRSVLAGAEAVHRALLPFVIAIQRHRPQDERLSGDRRWMVLNDAYLVAEDRVDAFTTAVRDAARQQPDLAVELTGPWPPYSFANAGEDT
jgi:gas vesicle protein GvpL/GvpF